MARQVLDLRGARVSLGGVDITPYLRSVDVRLRQRPRLWVGTPAGRPDMRPRLRMRITEGVANHRIYLEPGPDDWFGEVDLSSFVQTIDVHADCKSPSRAHLGMVRVNADVEFDNPRVALAMPTMDRHEAERIRQAFIAQFGGTPPRRRWWRR